jgi:transposase InsO family protein
MPWKEVLPMEQRVSFVLEVQKQEKSFAQLCRGFAISRKTGYKWWQRFCERGLKGLGERSRRPDRSPRASEPKWRERVIELREVYPWWGPKKLRVKLIARHGEMGVPAASTLGMMLRRASLVCTRRRRRSGPQIGREPLSQAQQSNDVWAVDFKGWFRTGDGRRCDPLTVSDLASRYVLCCAALSAQDFEQVRAVFKKLFNQYGLPRSIRVDNGSPFASRGAGGLSRLSVWWMRLGIAVEFIAPGHPEQNGIHERMHRTLKAEVTRRPSHNLRKQQKRFDEWRRHFNLERPHEALGQQAPALHYQASPRLYRRKGAQSEPAYPSRYALRRVRSNGEIKWRGRKRFLGEAFMGQLVALKQIGTDRHEVYFMDRLLGVLHEADVAGLRPSAYVRPHQRQEEQKV